MKWESVDIGKSMIYVCTYNINSPSINVYCHCAGCSSRVLTVQDLFSPTKYYNYISDTRPGPRTATLISLQICLICSSEPSAVQCVGRKQTCKQCLCILGKEGLIFNILLFRKVPIGAFMTSTVGANKNCILVFVNSSAQDASILKISVPIIKRRS